MLCDDFTEISFLEGGKSTASVIADEDETEVYRSTQVSVAYACRYIMQGKLLKVLFFRQPALAGRFYQYLAKILATRLKERESVMPSK